jgi:GntP family gluconate:H+ symporter
VNDAGFWLVKQYFNMSVVETFKTLETLLSVVGIIFIMILAAFV